MAFRPVYKFRGTSIHKAFLINAIVTAVIAALTIETRRILAEAEWAKDIPERPHKVLATIAVSVGIGFSTFLLMRLLIGSGESMMEGQMLKSFW